MKYATTRILAVCLALAALLVSCPSPLGTAKSGTITLSFSGAPRSQIVSPEVIDPTLAIKTLLVEVTGPGMEKLTSEPVAYDAAGTTLTMSIPAGPDRVVTISARNETGTALYSQTQTVTIIAGKELQLSFNLGGVAYTVSFNPNGGSGSMDPQSIAYGSSVALTVNKFIRLGYDFMGWAPSAEGEVSYADKASYTMGATGSVLYAQWSAHQYSISYDLNYAGSSGTLEFYTINSPDITLMTPTRDGFAFSGWFNDAGSTGAAIATIPAGSTGDKTLFAKWIAGQYIQGDGSGGGGGGASGAFLGGAGGAGGGDNDTLTGTTGNDIIFGDGSGGGKGGRGVGADDVTGTGAGLGGGGADSVNGGTGDDILFGDGFNGTMDQWNAGKGGFGGGGGGGSGGNLGTYLGAIGGLGAGSGSGYAGSVEPLVAGFGNSGGSGTTSGGISATSIASATGPGGASYGPINGLGGGGGFGGSSGGAGAISTGPGNVGGDGNTAEHRYDDITGSIHSYVLGRLGTILSDYPAYGAGIDTLDGGPDSDHLFGLGGADIFEFELNDAFNGNDIDTIWDFNVLGTDKLSLKIGGIAIDPTTQNDLITNQIIDVNDRKLVFSNGADKQVTIVIKNLGRDIVATDFVP